MPKQLVFLCEQAKSSLVGFLTAQLTINFHSEGIKTNRKSAQQHAVQLYKCKTANHASC